MRSFRLLALVALFVTAVACKKKTDPDPQVSDTGTVNVRFDNTAGGQPLQLNVIAFQNPAGNPYSVSMLKYYVTNMELVKSDGAVFKAGNYDLINEEDDESKRVSLANVPNGTYTHVRFFLGVDSIRNHTGVQDGDLDPIHGMIWTWNTGYIFFKHEGNFNDDAGDTKPLVYHYGTDKALTTVTLPLSGLVVNGNTKTVKLRFELNDLYNALHTVNFIDNNMRMSTSVDDLDWIKDLRENFPHAFHVTAVE